jgi:hypothetical protein
MRGWTATRLTGRPGSGWRSRHGPVGCRTGAFHAQVHRRGVVTRTSTTAGSPPGSRTSLRAHVREDRGNEGAGSGRGLGSRARVRSPPRLNPLPYHSHHWPTRSLTESGPAQRPGGPRRYSRSQRTGIPRSRGPRAPAVDGGMVESGPGPARETRTACPVVVAVMRRTWGVAGGGRGRNDTAAEDGERRRKAGGRAQGPRDHRPGAAPHPCRHLAGSWIRRRVTYPARPPGACSGGSGSEDAVGITATRRAPASRHVTRRRATRARRRPSTRGTDRLARLTGPSAPSAAGRDGAVSIPDRNPSALARRWALAEPRIHKARQEDPTG